MSPLVAYFVTVTAVGFVSSILLARAAIGDWLFERAQVPVEPDRRWVAIDLLITAVTGMIALSLFFAGGALVELGRARIIEREIAILWPYFITAGVTQVSLLRVFKLYSNRRLHELQQDEMVRA